MLAREQRGKRNNDEEQIPEELLARIPTAIKQAQQGGDIDMPAGEGIVSSQVLVNETQKRGKDITPLDGHGFDVSWEENEGSYSNRESQRASCNECPK